MFGGEVGVFGGEASPLPSPLDRTLVLSLVIILKVIEFGLEQCPI